MPNSRDRTALLVVDVQNDVVADGHRRDEVVSAIADLVTRARSADTPVIWVQHASDDLVEDTPGWHIVAELGPTPTEPLVHKRFGDSFEDTALDELLTGLGIGHLVVTGAQTDACIRSTIHGGFVRGYDVTLVADAHTTSDLSAYGAPPPDQVIAHTNLYWGEQTAPGRTAAVRAAAEVSFDPASAAL